MFSLFYRELWMCSVSAGDWWHLTQTYSISTAVMSIIGYIIGLGDRHLDNVLVNLTSGEVRIMLIKVMYLYMIFLQEVNTIHF